MIIEQSPISEEHKSAMFFNGVIGRHEEYLLDTFQDGEIMIDGVKYVGNEIIELAKKGSIDDNDFNDDGDSDLFDILVDKFFCVTFNGEAVDSDHLIWDNYDEAVKGFKEFAL